MRYFLKSGEEVVNRQNSHLHVNEGVLLYLEEALRQIDAEFQKFIVARVDFGRIIGKTNCIKTQPNDSVIYAKREGRFGHSRFVQNREPEDCSVMTVILKWDFKQKVYVLITTFIGEKSEPEPWDRNANQESQPFWQKHALVMGAFPIQEESLTQECPW